METTRHFTATVYVVNDAATLLHKHPTLGLWLPPGGHLQRDELPHEAGVREVREETGLEIELLSEPAGPRSDTARPLPQPEVIQLEDINIHADGVGHQHIDFIYFAESRSRELQPDGGEVPVTHWEWVGRTALAEDRFDPDITELGRQAIDHVRTH